MKTDRPVKILFKGLGLSLVLFILCLLFTYFIQQAVLSTATVETEPVAVAGDPNDPYLVIASAASPYEGEPAVEEVTIGDQVLMLDPAAGANLRRLYTSAQNAGIDLYFNDGYIDPETQQELYDEEIAVNGTVVNFENTQAGTNEHQTGLAVDVSTADTDYLLRQDFALTSAYNWLVANAPSYGFVVRYPQGKEDVTGVIYEPWHLRYVGSENARRMSDSGQVLEEYAGG